MVKDPAILFYTGDFLNGCTCLTMEERGQYITILCLQHQLGHLSEKTIRLSLGSVSVDVLKKLQKDSDGNYFNDRMEQEMTKRVKTRHKKTCEEIAIDKAKLDQILKDKKQKFYDDCKPFLVQYPKEMLREFYNYWIELNKSGTKMRYELQQTFEISRRLVTWARNDKNVSKTLSFDNITYKELLYRFNKGETDIWDKYEPVTSGDKRSLWKIKINNQ